MLVTEIPASNQAHLGNKPRSQDYYLGLQQARVEGDHGRYWAVHISSPTCSRPSTDQFVTPLYSACCSYGHVDGGVFISLVGAADNEPCTCVATLVVKAYRGQDDARTGRLIGVGLSDTQLVPTLLC